MPKTTGRMVEWWLGWLRTTEQYTWWHPRDHVWCERDGERDTEYGCETRSRLWLGDVDPPAMAPDRETRIQMFPDGAAGGLLKHCHEEMTYLAGFLPGLYARETGG
jgi:hypothetical protein